MFWDRLRYELRLLGRPVFWTPPLVMLGLFALLAVSSRNVTAATLARTLAAGLEILLPIAAGTVVATVALHDRALELQLSVPRRYHHTANLRFLLILLWSACICLLTSWLLYTFHDWRLPVQIAGWSEPWRFLAWQLTWLSSMLWLAALGLVVAVLMRSRTASGAVICVLAIAEIITHGDLDASAWYHPIYLFPLTFSPNASYWLTNRFELLGVAVVLWSLGWFLLRLPEVVLTHVTGDE